MGRNEGATVATWVLKTLSASKVLEPSGSRRKVAFARAHHEERAGVGWAWPSVSGAVQSLRDLVPATLYHQVAMATGRARLLHQHWLGVQALRLPLGGLGAIPGSGGFR